jgi:hypothetical protein
LAAAREGRRMMLSDNEVAAIALRRKGQNFSHIAEEIRVCRDVIGREGSPPAISKPIAAPRQGRGFWQCFD